MSWILSIIIAILGSGALTAIITNLFNLSNVKKKQSNGLSAGVRALLYDRIKFLGRKYISAKCISAEDLEDLIDMHRIYHDCLDGNGFLDSIMAQVRSLPFTDERWTTIQVETPNKDCK